MPGSNSIVVTFLSATSGILFMSLLPLRHVPPDFSHVTPPQHGSKEFTSHGTDHNEHSERGLQRYSLFATIRRHVLYKKTHNSYNNALCGQLFIVLLLLKALTLLCMHVASVWDNGEQFHPRKKNPLP